MSAIKAVDELRDYMRGHNGMNERIDKLEAEIAGRFMELPVDADGTLVKVGDTVYITRNMPLVGLGKKDEYIVRGVGDDLAWIVKKGSNALDTCVYAHELRHVEPRTLIDVLADFAAEVENDRNDYETAKRYADEIRELMGAGE